MGTSAQIIDFPIHLTKGKGESQFVTILHEPDMVIKWNQGQLFYIQHSNYPVESRILTYKHFSSRLMAQIVAKEYLDLLRKEHNPNKQQIGQGMVRRKPKIYDIPSKV